MLYLYPYISFATVDLNHFNLWADKMRADGYPVKNQKSAFGTGLVLGYKANLLNMGVSFAILYSSSTSGWNPINGVYSERTHSLLNFLMNVPVGLNYPLSDQFSVLVAFKPIWICLNSTINGFKDNNPYLAGFGRFLKFHILRFGF
jgi:hypothetical protein